MLPRRPRDEREGSSSREAVNPRIGLSLLPVLVFWIVRRRAGPELAIGAGFAASALVFASNRGPRGVVGTLAIAGFAVTGGAAAVGLVFGSEKAYLANDAAGDFLIAFIAAASIYLRRPIVGLIALELAPRLRPVLDARHRVFVLCTLLVVGTNVAQGVVRIALLQNLSVDAYLLWSRVVSWPLSIVGFAVIFTLIRRAALRQSPAPSPS